ncbi:MAG: hypothetical protein WC725_04805 [Patescibacteria group bacterium]|jgi:ssDNA-binding Zn-finger/Zn-ribbon topoisomerase 1
MLDTTDNTFQPGDSCPFCKGVIIIDKLPHSNKNFLCCDNAPSCDFKIEINSLKKKRLVLTQDEKTNTLYKTQSKRLPKPFEKKIYYCPFCGKALVIQRIRTDYFVYKCEENNCEYYQNNLFSLTAEQKEIYQLKPYKFRLRYYFRRKVSNKERETQLKLNIYLQRFASKKTLASINK